jgi:hypothetical protein
VKKLLELLVLITGFAILASCQKESKRISKNPEYWSIHEKIKEVWKSLEDSGTGMTRQIILGDEIATDTLENPDWETEMNLFKLIKVSPVDWKSGYDIQVGRDGVPRFEYPQSWSFQAVDENIEVKDIKIFLGQDQKLKRLEAFIHEKNLFRRNGKRLHFDAESGFSMEIRDTLFLGEPVSTSIQVRFNRN